MQKQGSKQSVARESEPSEPEPSELSIMLTQPSKVQSIIIYFVMDSSNSQNANTVMTVFKSPHKNQMERNQHEEIAISSILFEPQ
jgi:hypothetical protein